MSRLLRTSEIAKHPVVTLAGEDVAQVKDIVYAPDGGAVDGFTLAGRGLLAGPLKQSLPWSAVLAVGADAVMVRDEDSLADRDAVFGDGDAKGSRRSDVLGSRVLTDTGTDLGTVTDVVVEVEGGDRCDVVGYEIEASPALESRGTRLLVPLPDTLAASGEHLIVPAAAADFVGDDLAGFGAAVEQFRARLEGRS